MNPASFKRKILLAVTGLSPQIVTETLYALTQAAPRESRFIPTEIHLITTVEGSERARLMLFEHEGGCFNRFCEEYGINRTAIEFGAETIHVVCGADGAPLHDIVDEMTSAAVADLITQTIRAFTADPDCAVHASIAGGRKTMGFYLGYALSLYGRTQDRLSHVLVSAPFESDHQFYYPPAMPTTLIIKDRPVRTDEARILLADIPFVRLRHGLPDKLLEGRVSFSATVAAAQQALGPARLKIDLEGKAINAGGRRIELPPAELAFLSWFARRLATGRGPVGCPPDGAPDKSYAAEYLGEYEQISDPMVSGTAKRLQSGMDKTFFEEKKAKLHRRLREALGPEGLLRYGIQGQGKPRLFCLPMEPGVVEWCIDGEEPHG